MRVSESKSWLYSEDELHVVLEDLLFRTTYSILNHAIQLRKQTVRLRIFIFISFFILRFVAKMDPDYSAQDVALCDLCKTAIAQSYCDFCHVNFYKPCIGEHITADYDKHKLFLFFKENLP